MVRCDHDHEASELRILPINSQAHAVVCNHHYQHELLFRLNQVTVYGHEGYDFPTWQSLKVYWKENE